MHIRLPGVTFGDCDGMHVRNRSSWRYQTE